MSKTAAVVVVLNDSNNILSIQFDGCIEEDLTYFLPETYMEIQSI